MQLLDICLDSPQACIVIRRLNRFVVEIDVGGSRAAAWINNTGRLHDYLFEGNRGYCLKNVRPGRTTYRLFALAESGRGAVIDTQLQMKAFERAQAAGLLPWLKGCTMRKRNPRLGGSLPDYLFRCGGKDLYLEVKSAVLREGHYAMYPDCPTARGRRHIRELSSYSGMGGAAALVFIAALPGVQAFKPYRQGDPELCELLKEAALKGVDIRALSLLYDPQDACMYLIDADLPVEL